MTKKMYILVEIKYNALSDNAVKIATKNSTMGW